MTSQVNISTITPNDSLPRVENDILSDDGGPEWRRHSLAGSPKPDRQADPQPTGRISRTSLTGSVSSLPGTGLQTSRPNTAGRPQSRKSIPSRKDSLLRRIQSIEKINLNKSNEGEDEDTQEDLEREVAALERSLSGTVLDMKRRPTTGSVRGGHILISLNVSKDESLPPVPVHKPKTHLPAMEDRSSSDTSLPSGKDKLPPITPREDEIAEKDTALTAAGDPTDSKDSSLRFGSLDKMNTPDPSLLTAKDKGNSLNEMGGTLVSSREWVEKEEVGTKSDPIYDSIADDDPGIEVDIEIGGDGEADDLSTGGNDNRNSQMGSDLKIPRDESTKNTMQEVAKENISEEGDSGTDRGDSRTETKEGVVEETGEGEGEKFRTGSRETDNSNASEKSEGNERENPSNEDQDGEEGEMVIKPSKPKWHPPWQLSQEIIAHLPSHSIPCVSLESGNKWFATGSSDKTIKIWDINTGLQRLTIKAHKGPLRALIFGQCGHRLLYSAGDDRQLVCNDIEVNRVVARFPDQSTVVYGMSLYNPCDMLVTCGRDKLVKIWDNRLEKAVRTLRGHMNTVSCVTTIESTRQIVSGSHDSTLRIWDIGEGRCIQILTGHHKSVRALALHPEEPIISSASTERIIHWHMPQGENIGEILAEGISMNCLAVNPQGVLVAAGSKGSIHLWDWKTGHKFQKIHRTKVYESQEVPICVWTTTFDRTGSKLISSDAGNVVKLYKEAYTRVRRRNNVRDDRSISNPIYQSKRASSLSPVILP